MNTEIGIDNTERTVEDAAENKNEIRVNEDSIIIVSCPHCGEDCIWIESEEEGTGELKWILGDATLENEVYEPHWCKSAPTSMLKHEETLDNEEDN